MKDKMSDKESYGRPNMVAIALGVMLLSASVLMIGMTVVILVKLFASI